jgi:hypothetical protein
MLWRTFVLSGVNAVTALLIFVPLFEITTTGMEDAIYLHSGPLYIFGIQVGLGIFAVVIDMMNKKVKLQSKLITAAVVLSGTYAGIIIWLSSTAEISCLSNGKTLNAGTFLPLLNVVFFFSVWVHQRRSVIQ